MFTKQVKFCFSLLSVALFCGALMFLPGCNLFGPGGAESILEAPLAKTGNSSVNFNIVLPEPSVRASISETIRPSSDQSVTVTFSLTLIDTSANRSWVVSQTVTVGTNGQADVSFDGLPDVTVVGEIRIEGGTRGGYNEFHGAADLQSGANDLDVGPKGSGSVADITAKLVIKATNNPDLAQKLPRNVATVAKSSAEQVGELDDPLESEKKAFDNFISSNLNQATYVNLVIEGDNLKASGKSTWQKSLSELVASVDYTESNWKFHEVVSQGFGASAYVSIKSLDETKFALLKINSADGKVTYWLVNEGSCKPVMVLGDGSVLVGGTLGSKPIVFRWNGTSNKVLTSTDSSLSKWATRLDVSATADIPDPIVKNFYLGVGDRLTCMVEDPATKFPISFVLDNNTGTIISEHRAPTLRVWAQGMPAAISIGWDLHPDAKSYNLYYAPGDTEPDKTTSDKIASVLPTYTHTNLAVDTTYKYLVTWVDKDNVEHEYPALAKATALAAEEFAGGDGSETFPYQIANWIQLNEVRNNLDKHFVLKNNLTSQTAGYDDYASSTANVGKGWEPIGTSAEAFAGGFDGADFKIADLCINRPSEEYVGLFGNINNSISPKQIKNLVLENVDITGGYQYVGAVAGRLGSGIADNCHVSGTISGDDRYVGAIAGSLWNGGEIRNCTNQASVSAKYFVGGIVGALGSGTSADEKLLNNVNSGSITGTSTSAYVGGVAGGNYAIVDSCSNTGRVVGYGMALRMSHAKSMVCVFPSMVMWGLTLMQSSASFVVGFGEKCYI